MKFVQLILRNIIKIVENCCHQISDFKAKMHQIRFRLGLCPRPCWGSLQRSHRPPSWISGGLLLREGKGGKRGEERREEKGGREEGRGGEGRGEEAFLVMWPRRLSALNPPLDTLNPKSASILECDWCVQFAIKTGDRRRARRTSPMTTS